MYIQSVILIDALKHLKKYKRYGKMFPTKVAQLLGEKKMIILVGFSVPIIS